MNCKNKLCSTCGESFTPRSSRNIFCSIKCQIERNIKRGTEEECWPWIAATNPGGYGKVDYKGKSLGVHKVVYELNKGPVGDKFVLHTCDNRICANPNHLFLGTHEDNMADMVSKNRQASGDRNGLRKNPERALRGIENGNSKLDEWDVRFIRHWRSKGHSFNSIAKSFGVWKKTIMDIINGLTWRHVGD